MISKFIAQTGIASKLAATASLILLCGIGSLNAIAQDAVPSPAAATFTGPRIDPTTTHEITVAGNIQQVISTNTPDLRVSLLTPQGIFTTDLGPAIAKDIKPTLTSGQQIQISGTIQTVNGQTVLFARLLTFNDRLVIVRNERGFPVHTTAGTLAAAQALQNGAGK